MKTLNELKKIFIGEVLAEVWFVLFMELYCWIDETNMNWDIETICIMIGWLIFSFVTTYIGWILFKGVKSDVEDIKKAINKKKTEA